MGVNIKMSETNYNPQDDDEEIDDEDNDEDAKQDGERQRTFTEPTTSAGPSYPDKGTDHIYDDRDYPSANVHETSNDEQPPPVIKKQIF